MLPLLRRFLSNITTRRYAQVHDVQIKYVKEVVATGNEAKTMTEKNGKHVGLQRVSSRNVGVCDPCTLHCDAISRFPSAREDGGLICLCPAGLSVTFSSHSKKKTKKIMIRATA
jgi:hypothetical protein